MLEEYLNSSVYDSISWYDEWLFGESNTILPEFLGAFIHKTPAKSLQGWQCLTLNDSTGFIFTQASHFTSIFFWKDGMFEITFISRLCNISSWLPISNGCDCHPP